MDYTIKQGDTLANIAKQYNTTPEQIGLDNKIADINKIYTGQNIRIPTVSPTASISSITTPSQVNIPTIQTPTPISSAPIDATKMSAEQYLAQFQQAPLVAQAQGQTLMSKLSDIMGIQAGKSVEQANLEQQAGLEQQRKNILDLTNTLNAITTANDAQKLQVGQLGGRGLPSTGRRTAELDRETAIKALPISAQINAAQGNLALAESNIQNYIKTKYEGIDNQIANVKYFIEQNRADMTAEEKKRADQQAIRLSDYERQITDKKAQDEAIQKIAITAGGYGANSAIISRISNSQDVNTAIANATGYLSDPQDRAIKQAQLAKIYQDIRQSNANMTTGVIAEAQALSGITSQPNFSKLKAKEQTQAVSLDNLLRELNLYKQDIANTSIAGGVNLFGEDAARLSSRLNSLLFAAAQAEGTGALQEADRQVLEQSLPNLTTPSGAFTNLRQGGLRGVNSKIDVQINKYTENLKNLGIAPTDIGNTDNDPLGLGI